MSLKGSHYLSYQENCKWICVAENVTIKFKFLILGKAVHIYASYRNFQEIISIKLFLIAIILLYKIYFWDSLYKEPPHIKCIFIMKIVLITDHWKQASFIIILTTTLSVSSIQSIIVGKGPRGRIVHRTANYNSVVSGGWHGASVLRWSEEGGGEKAGGRSPPADLTQSLLAPNGLAPCVIPSYSLNTHCYTELYLPIPIQAIHTLTYGDWAQLGHVEPLSYL